MNTKFSKRKPNSIKYLLAAALTTQALCLPLYADIPTVTSGTQFLHLTADDLGLADTDPVATWTDTVNANAFTGTATYAANYANGHAGVSFDGVTNWLSQATLDGTKPNVGSLSLFVVGNFGLVTNNAGVTDYMIAGQYPDGTALNRLRICNFHEQGRLDVRVGGGSTETAITNLDSNVHVYSIVSTGVENGTWDVAIDGKVLRTGSNGAAPADMIGLSLGANKGGSFFDGVIAEVLIYDAPLTTNDFNLVQDYLLQKYLGHPLDTDTDGLSDIWEVDQFGDLASSSGGGDNFDGDVHTDEEEWIAGTDATDPNSFFTITMGNVGSGAVEVAFYAIPGRTYTQEVTDDISQTNGWVAADALSSLPSSGQQTFLMDATAAEGFTRVRVSLE